MVQWEKGDFGAQLLCFSIELIIFQFFHGGAKFADGVLLSQGCKILSGGTPAGSGYVKDYNVLKLIFKMLIYKIINIGT